MTQIGFSSPTSISEQLDIAGKSENGELPTPLYFSLDPSTNWETSTTTTVTVPRSQRSTLQRDQMPPPPSNIKSSMNPKPHHEDEGKKFRSHEKYFEHKAYVFGHKYSSSREMMWAGKHSFPFTYVLPSKLPASFHGRFGYVRYFCEASLERHNLSTIQRRAFFSVSTIMDLNADSKADSGVSKEKKTNSWCFCCASGTIIVSAKIKKRGFVPGETIPIQAHILNVSNKTIAKTSAKIIQIATYYSSKAFRNHVDETVVCEKIEGTIPPGESSIWDDDGPRVPPIPPSSTMIDCKLITLDYRLDFVLDIIGAKEPLILRMPLRIGTIPLEKVFKKMEEPSEDDLFWLHLKAHFPVQIHLKYPKLPAAYSIKCVKGDQNVNRYYFRQIPRSMHSMMGINLRMPQAPLRPVITDDGEMYAPRYVTYKEIQKNEGSSDEDKGEKELLNEKLNGTILSDESIPSHLMIRVSPPSHNRRVTPNSATQLITDTASVHSGSTTPSSLRSYRSFNSKTSIPSIKLDLVDFISDPAPKNSMRHRISTESDNRSSEELASVVANFLEKEKNNSQWESKKNK